MHHSSEWRAGYTTGPRSRTYAAASAQSLRVVEPLVVPPGWATFVRAIRRAADLTQAELADKIGIARTTIGRWERRETAPDGRAGAEIVTRLCDYFGVPLADAYRALGQPPPRTASIVEQLGVPLVAELVKFFESDKYSAATKSRIARLCQDVLGLATPDAAPQRRRRAS